MTEPAATEPQGARAVAANAGVPRYVVIMLGVAATLGTIVLMHQFSGVIGPIFLAVNLVIAAYPIHTWLRSKGTPAWLSATIMLLAVIVVLLAAVAGLVWAVSAMINQLPSYSGQWSALYNQVMDLLRHFNINTTGMSDIMQQISPSSLVGMLSTAFSYTTAVTGVVATIVLSLLFLALDTPGMHVRLNTAAAAHPDLARSMSKFGHDVRTYWVAATVFGAIVAAFDGLALAVMGVPLPIVWALLAFLTNYIPNIGFVIGVIPPALLALLGSGWQLALLVIVVYLVINFIIQTLIQPRVVGESVGVMTTVSFISLLLWGFVLGGVGTLIALPMTLFLKALFIDSDPKAAWLGALISSNTSKKRRETAQKLVRPGASSEN